MRHTMRTSKCLVAVPLLLGLAVYAGEVSKKTWTFENESAGAPPKGFTPSVGEWNVMTTDEGKVLAQSARNANPVFNIVLVDDTMAKDVDVSVKVKALAGEL